MVPPFKIALPTSTAMLPAFIASPDEIVVVPECICAFPETIFKFVLDSTFISPLELIPPPVVILTLPPLFPCPPIALICPAEFSTISPDVDPSIRCPLAICTFPEESVKVDEPEPINILEASLTLRLPDDPPCDAPEDRVISPPAPVPDPAFI